MEILSEVYRDLIKKVVALSKSETVVTEHNVYQEAVPGLMPLIDTMVGDKMLPGSGITGMENLSDLYEKAVSGKSCLLLLEHYSNFDLPMFIYLLRQEGELGLKLAEHVVAIAGLKLNEDPVVAAFAAAYSRIVIFPSRSLTHLDAEKDREELIRINSINRAAMKSLNKVKYEGKMILVFPAGTRYRPWEPSTKQGVREIDSYIKSFDYMCPVAINGELLHIRQGKMMDDSISPDVVRYTAGQVMPCAEFRNRMRDEAEAAGIEDKKQAAVDGVMKVLEELHEKAEPDRQKIIRENTQS
ncbi:1-acyl-sn-glycerol-3-phosphate acyltransferase [Breznakiella homolactica]|uniref:1-acyl-sn-glycerol-3-phosphate acyltransferase n=1 Tax=Breznakiella homolactica TaxID=2798577 RepID=A0A7T7XPC3_9SPIR|nr:1-acyl-sn-glycerol-3-phosphate acyltransferase [Breznakiella homolactica]QQO10064.1 1-acyl-sn-glycerol-3-phosphate acyltransferase [Breznakiella homolactica]